MKTSIGFCGLDCEKCEAKIATVKNDDTLREAVAKKWTEHNGIEITKDMINCVGCKQDGPKTPFCDYMCEIKKCAISNKHETCASCKDMSNCKKLSEIIANSPEAVANLKSM